MLSPVASHVGSLRPAWAPTGADYCLRGLGTCMAFTTRAACRARIDSGICASTASRASMNSQIITPHLCERSGHCEVRRRCCIGYLSTGSGRRLPSPWTLDTRSGTRLARSLMGSEPVPAFPTPHHPLTPLWAVRDTVQFARRCRIGNLSTVGPPLPATFKKPCFSQQSC